MLRGFFIVTLITTCSTVFSQAPYQEKFPLLDRYIDSLMKEWNIPGMAIGIVYKDSLIYAKGFGYRDLENKLPVEAGTIFPIASNTKLFTATLACVLASEGKLQLDQPVRHYLPSLRFSNEELNSRVTLRDMLSHRTGLPRYDGIWIGDTSTRQQVLSKIVYMKPQLTLREGYIYNNLMFVASGAVMEAVTGQSWEALTRERIFKPLGMSHTVFGQHELKEKSNIAYSYYTPDSSSRLLRRTFSSQCDALGPAGTIKSNLIDMSRWMIAQLNGGRYKSRQVIPESAILQTLVPNSIDDREGRWQEVSNGLYGLGRVIAMYKGYKITSHTGSIDGFYSNLTFIPSLGIGIFMVHNGENGGSIRSMMAYPVIDRLLGLSLTPWSERYRKDFLRAQAAYYRAKDSVTATQVKGTLPSHPLSDFTGTFSNPVYGDIKIELKQGGLQLHFRKQQLPLEHFHYDQFRTNMGEATGQPDYRLHFITNSRGAVDRISIQPFGEPLAEFIKK